MRKSSVFPVLEIYAPDLFEDEAFASWLNRRVGKGLATWHTGGEPGEMSDVFVLYDHGEGDESPRSAGTETGMPEHCWDRLCEFAQAEGMNYCLLRLINCE